MKRAVSLMELLIVMSIIALVSAITIPTVRHYLPSWQLSSVASVVTGKLRQAQEEAVTTQIRHGACFKTTPTPNEIELVSYIPLTSTITTIENVKLPNNISLTPDATMIDQPIATYNCIIFGSDGAPAVNGKIDICQEGVLKKQITISPAGVVKVVNI